MGRKFSTWVTDSKGRFVFSDVPEGLYNIAAEHVNYLTGLAGEQGPRVSDRLLGLEKGFKLRVSAGQWLRDVTISLWPPASISGTVLNSYGEPVINRHVRALAAEASSHQSAFALSGSAVTDDRGNYSIGRLLPGQYYVVVTSKESDQQALPTAYQQAVFPSSLTLRNGDPVEVRRGQQVERIDFHLRAAPTHTIAGRVVGSLGLGRRAQLALLPAGDTYAGPATQVALCMVEKDASFSCAPVPDGDYEIVSSPLNNVEPAPPTMMIGEPRSWILPDAEQSLSPPEFWTRYPVTLRGQDLLDVTIPVQSLASLAGRIELDAPDARLPGNIMALPVSSQFGLAPRMATVKNEFLISGLVPGSYYLSPTDPLAVQSIRIGQEDFTHRALELGPGTEVKDIVLTVTASARISGQVRTAEGRAATDSIVVYFPEDRQKRVYIPQSMAPVVDFVYTRNDGSYETWPTLPTGQYYVVAAPASWHDRFFRPDFLDAVARLATLVTLGRGERRTQDLILQKVDIK